ncbi:MAG: hypothetical protein ACRCTY_09705 [Candidatus Adiutrix sp.]
MIDQILIQTMAEAASSDEWRKKIERSRLHKKYEANVMKTVHCLRDGAKTDDIDLLLSQESALMSMRLENSANSKEEVNSLKMGMEQIEACRKSLDILRGAPEDYKDKVAQTYAKRVEAGLPIDSAREFFKSHPTRLQNLLSSEASHADKALYRQRRENVNSMQDIYIGLQQKALGIEPKQQKGLKR